MSDIRDVLRDADGGPVGAPDHEVIRHRGGRLLAARFGGMTAAVLAVLAVAGGIAFELLGDRGAVSPPVVDAPGRDRDPSLDGAVRLEITRVVDGTWPEEHDRTPQVEVTDQELIVELAEASSMAPTVESVVIDELAEPDYQVAFLDEQGHVLERLGYYTNVQRWGEHEGRWIDGWEPLALTFKLPVDGLDASDDPRSTVPDDSEDGQEGAEGRAENACESDEARRNADPPGSSASVAVYFSCPPDLGLPDEATVYRFEREVDPAASTQERLSLTLTEYLEGPSEEQQRRGYSSALTGSKVRSVVVEEGHAVVDFNDSLEELGGFGTPTFGRIVIAELAENVFQFSDIESVSFELEGSCRRFAALLEPFDFGCLELSRTSYEAFLEGRPQG